MKNLLIILGTLGMLGGSIVPSIVDQNHSNNNVKTMNSETFSNSMSFVISNEQQSTINLTSGLYSLNQLYIYVYTYGINYWLLDNFKETFDAGNDTNPTVVNSWSIYNYENLVEVIKNENFVRFTNYYVELNNNGMSTSGNFYLEYLTTDGTVHKENVNTVENLVSSEHSEEITINYIFGVDLVWPNS